MPEFKFFALGGLGEIGKNMYCLEIDNKIFVLDCGSSTPYSQVFGYDLIVPEFKYLIENKEKIQGVFLTNFKEKYIGGVVRFFKDLKVPFYISNFTAKAIESRYLKNLSDEEKEGLEFQILDKKDVINFDDIEVSFINVTNTLPDTFAISIKVPVDEEGNHKHILYFPDFNFDQNVSKHFKISFKTLNRIAEEGVLALLSPSTGAIMPGHITTDGRLDLYLHKLIAHQGRTYILMEADNVKGMIDVIDACNFQNRQVTIIGNKARTLVEIAMDLGYCPKYENNYLPKRVLNDELRNSENTVIIIAGEQAEEFFALQKIARFEDPHYTLKPTDNVALLLNTPKKYEKILANTWDNIWMVNANLIDFDTKLMPETLCGEEDLKFLYSFLNPEYIIPISGDYRMMRAQVDLALKYGYDKEHVIELENGNILTFTNGVPKKEKEQIETGDILFIQDSDSDINDYVAREREALTQEGFIVISSMIDLRQRKLYGDIEVEFSGFIPKTSETEIVNKIKEKSKEIIAEYLKEKKVDYKELRSSLKNEISKLILKETKKRPVLISIIIDIS